MVTSSAVSESREAALVRLAVKARQDGIKLYRDPRDGRHYASSRSQPGTLHYVTAVSCDCPGFFHHGRCKHHAALMTALGWGDTTPEPSTPTPAVCLTCNGTGSIPATIATGASKWVYGNETCTGCHGRGIASETAA